MVAGIGFDTTSPGVVVTFADGRDFQLNRIPGITQGLHQDRFDDEQDIFARGVVCAALTAFVRVKAALKEGTEDGRFDGFPIELRRFRQFFYRVYLKGFDCDDFEERAVEVGDVAHEHASAFVHGDKEILNILFESARLAARMLNNVAEDALRLAGHGGQQANIFREEAKYQFGQEIGNARRLGIPVAHVVGDQLKGVGSLVCYLIGVAARMQAFWRVEHVA